MNDEIIIIDQRYKYEVDETVDGGVGYVRLMTLKELSCRPPDNVVKPVSQEGKYPYRKQLAAKTIKHKAGMSRFTKACDLWCGLNDTGIVPLLKTVEIGDEILALMPRYAGNLCALLQDGRHSLSELLKALYRCIFSLSKLYTERKITHQDLKPQNVLYCYHNRKLILELSDWGIADVQGSLLPVGKSERIEALAILGCFLILHPKDLTTTVPISARIFSVWGWFSLKSLQGVCHIRKRKAWQTRLSQGNSTTTLRPCLKEKKMEK